MECYGTACPYAVTIDSSGSYSANPASTSVIIGYESTALIGRVCVPSSTVFAGAFLDYVNTFSTYLSQNGLSSFITDIENVRIFLDRIGNGFWQLLDSRLSFRLSSCTLSNALLVSSFGSQPLESLWLLLWPGSSSSTMLGSSLLRMRLQDTWAFRLSMEALRTPTKSLDTFPLVLLGSSCFCSYVAAVESE